jgi:D-methionine transport system permease protein
MTPDQLSLAIKLLPIELWNTIYMVLVATFFALVLGLPLGIILTITDHGNLKPFPLIHKLLGTLVNIGRSFPFAILMVALIPFTRWVIGTSLGTTAAIVPLAIAAAPFIARLVENALKEVDRQIVEAAVVMGSSTFQIILKILLPEALPSLILGMTLTIVNVIGYSAMAGLVGGGGLGKVAIQYGYNRFDPFIMITTVVLLIILVQGVQWQGNALAKKITRKRGKATHD